MDELTADNLVLRVNSLGWSGCSYWCYKVMPLLVGAVAILLTQACNVRAEYEAPFSGKPLLRILQSSATVSCFSDLSATTGYYGKEEGKPDTFLTSAPLKSQRAGGGYKISIKDDTAVVTDEVFGQSYQFQILERDAKGVILTRDKGVGVEVITIDPQNGSFVLTDSGVQSRLWNRTNVWVGRCN